MHAEQFSTDLALLQHKQAHAVDLDAVSSEWCESCGNEIPEARRKAVLGVTLCVECAREDERRAKQWR
ncbi:MAG: TraR/DksA C4-type zinc finger protein [Methylobacter tundripaludum]|nr:TraR/DksA C4-type zinc finger protein [Methylobacter tundripaludum]